LRGGEIFFCFFNQFLECVDYSQTRHPSMARRQGASAICSRIKLA
jgi:hypothetical protein